MANVISPKEGCWIQYQLKLNNHTHKTVAEAADCSVYIVSHFLRGHKGSERVRLGLCKVLGYKSFDGLLANIPQECKGGAA